MHLPALFKELTCDFQKCWEDGSPFPLLLSPSSNNRSWEDLAKAISEREWLETALAKCGALLIRGFDLNTAQEVDEIIASTGWEEYDYCSVGGSAGRTRVCGRVLSVNDEVGLDKTIGFHSEAAYLDDMPTKVIFFCKTPPEEGAGGATPILQGSIFLKKLRQRNPDLVRSLLDKGFKFYGEGKIGEKLARDKRYNRVFGLCRRDPRGEEAWCNSIGTITGGAQLLFGDGSQVPQEAIDCIFGAMEEEKVVFQWQKGDLIIIENTMVLHSRQPCATSSSARSILISMAK